MITKNFEKLATLLETMLDDDKRFNLNSFFDTFESVYAYDAYKLAGEWPEQECGTTACALGFGPLAGIPMSHLMGWSDYFLESFMGISQPLERHESLEDRTNAWSIYRWCFDEGWDAIDPTAKGAAARIRHMLAGRKITDVFTEKAKRRYRWARV